MRLLKRFTALSLALVFSLVFTIAVAASPQAAGFSLMIDGESVALDGQTFVSHEGMTLLPLRFLFERLGGDGIEWVAEERMVILVTGENETRLRIDTTDVATTAEHEIALETAAIIFNDRTFVPASFLASLMDVTTHIDASEQMVLIADNARLERITRLMESAESADHPPMVTDMVMDMIMVIAAEDITEEMTMRTVGTMKSDPSVPFMHQRLVTTVLGEELISEIFDDGEYTYIVVEDMVLKMPSMLGLLESAIAGSSPIAGIDIARQYYAGLRLVEDAYTITISGNMSLPQQYFDDILSYFSNLAGIPGIEDLDMEMDITFNAPIFFYMVFDRDSELLIYMAMEFDMEMRMTVEGEAVLMHMVFSTSMPRIEYNVEFDTIVPAEIVAAAIAF